MEALGATTNTQTLAELSKNIYYSKEEMQQGKSDSDCALRDYRPSLVDFFPPSSPPFNPVDSTLTLHGEHEAVCECVGE